MQQAEQQQQSLMQKSVMKATDDVRLNSNTSSILTDADVDKLGIDIDNIHHAVGVPLSQQASYGHITAPPMAVPSGMRLSLKKL